MPDGGRLVVLISHLTAEQRRHQTMAANLQIRPRLRIFLTDARMAEALIQKPLGLAILFGPEDRVKVILLPECQAVILMKPSLGERGPCMSGR